MMSQNDQEDALREAFVLRMTTQGWKEYDREWYVVQNHDQYGIGDLVMTRPDGQYVVIEVKFIEWWTANRTKKRKEVKEQAAYYANVFQLFHPEISHKKIRCATVTDYNLKLDYRSKGDMGNEFSQRFRELKQYLQIT